MLVLEAVWKELRRAPAAVQLGIGILVFGGAADVVTHLSGGAFVAGTTGHAPGELTAHLVGFAGMVVVLAGVLVDGVRRGRSAAEAGSKPNGGQQ
jgi:hypothetical protein